MRSLVLFLLLATPLSAAELKFAETPKELPLYDTFEVSVTGGDVPANPFADITLSGEWKAKWYNPHTGEWKESTVEGGNWKATAPDTEDWAILLRKSFVRCSRFPSRTSLMSFRVGLTRDFLNPAGEIAFGDIGLGTLDVPDVVIS
jgi:hypothetical protein